MRSGWRGKPANRGRGPSIPAGYPLRVRLTFLGAAGGVTGSCTLVEGGGARLLVDCGMFQGRAADEALNRRKFSFQPRRLDGVILTHAHVDHSGLLPRLSLEGFRGPILCTPATRDLARLLLFDSARVQEADARDESRRRLRAGMRPVAPIYGADAVDATFRLVRGVPYGQAFDVKGIRAVFQDAGHILGSASVLLEVEGERLCFSGDIGPAGQPIVRDPAPAPLSDLLVLESTYGDRDHPSRTEMDDALAEILARAARDGGTVLIPAFAVGRAQEVLYRLRTLSDERRLPFPNVYLDSPLAIRASQLVREHRECLDAEALERLEGARGLFRSPQLHVVADRKASAELNDDERPKIVVAASGMCTGGPILHHLRHHLWRENTDVVFVGFQAEGTLGRKILDGARSVRIHGRTIAVKARVHYLPGLSAHADRNGLLAWAKSAGRPARVFLNHGEEPARRALAALLADRLGLVPALPARGEAFEIAKTRPGSDRSGVQE